MRTVRIAALMAAIALIGPPPAAAWGYVAHQPLHATNNYDGQLTGNSGVHARFERDLIERFQSRLVLKPARARALTNPREAGFDALLSSYRLVAAVLKADSEASGGRNTY